MGPVLNKFSRLKKYKTILSILSFLLIGCSSAYKVSDFSSKDEFKCTLTNPFMKSQLKFI